MLCIFQNKISFIHSGSSYADNTNLDQIDGGLAAFAANKGNATAVCFCFFVTVFIRYIR